MGWIRCSACKNKALEYDDNILPYLSGDTKIRATHFKKANLSATPLQCGEEVKCCWCSNDLLIQDIRKEWKRIKTGEWDI